MLRKLILSGVLVLTLIVPAVSLPQVRGDDTGPRHSHHAHYDVMYRRDHHHRWRLYGTYESRHAAEHVAHDLRHQGFEVHIDIR